MPLPAPLPARNSAALRALSVLGGQFIGLIVKARIWAVSARCGAFNQRLLLCQNEPGLAHAVTAGTLPPPMYAPMLCAHVMAARLRVGAGDPPAVTLLNQTKFSEGVRLVSSARAREYVRNF